ncbi:MAG: glycosyltransferase [Endozoicomonadaceae bacterium]|nr:glycosyltransferase [Endozoicomonadaceae bacterium]
MINVLITVGTTEFDELIEFIDEISLNLPGFNMVAQISSSAVYSPRNISFFDFSDDFESYVESADVIISHAGAGSVYSMLEKGKKLIVVPNLTRVDKHQLELANFVQKNNFSIVCNAIKELEGAILRINKTSFNVYEKDDFFALDIVRELLK